MVGKIIMIINDQLYEYIGLSFNTVFRTITWPSRQGLSEHACPAMSETCTLVVCSIRVTTSYHF